MAYFGWHLSSVGGWTHMVDTALSAHADTFAFFPRPPRGGPIKKLDEADFDEFLRKLHEDGFGPLVPHAPYVYNLAAQDETIRTRTIQNIKQDIERLELIGKEHPIYYNFHPGAHTGQGRHIGINKIIDALNEIITPGQNTVLLLETMAGKGTEIGSNFDELEQIIDGVDHSESVGICLDTCHTNDAGMNVATDFNQVLDEFDSVCGLSKLLAIHLNDSKNVEGSKKDRHEKLGRGTLGIKGIQNIVCNPRVSSLPFILETPNDYEGYEFEISILRKLVAGHSVEEIEALISEQEAKEVSEKMNSVAHVDQSGSSSPKFSNTSSSVPGQKTS